MGRRGQAMGGWSNTNTVTARNGARERAGLKPRGKLKLAPHGISFQEVSGADIGRMGDGDDVAGELGIEPGHELVEVGNGMAEGESDRK